MPNQDQDLVRTYWDSRAQGYAVQTADEMQGDKAEHWNRLLADQLKDLPATASIADMGCGAGALLLRCAKMGFSCIGIDISDEMCNQAARLAQNEGVSNRVRLLHGNVENPPLPAQSQDVIMSRNLLWNLPHPQQAYKAWIAALKPGGRLIVGDGNHYRWLTSEKYRLAHDANPAFFAHDPRYLLNVDTSTIDHYAQTLPLTHEDRPNWDLRILSTLGMEDLTVSVLSELPLPNTNVKLPFDFLITAHKPYCQD